jgi:hypothetical protein
VAEPPSIPSATQIPEPSNPGVRPTLAVGVGALVGFGVSSSPVPFGRVFGNLAWPRWSLELAAEVGLPSTIRRADPDRAGFVEQPLLAGFAGCGALGPWGACLLAKAGAIRIAGKIDAPVSVWGPLVETGFRLTLTQPLGRRVFVAVRAEGLLIVTRWRVTLDDAPVWTSSRFTEIIGLDVGVRFP